jgi:hypothetical protein
MPIEIREIIIRTRIENQLNNQEPVDVDKIKQEILQECLKKVHQKLQEQFER